MKAFTPKHNNLTYRKTGEGIFITFDNHIVATHALKNKILSSNTDKYQILYEDAILTYNDLKVIDNAISVSCFFACYLILLSNGKLIYIVSNVERVSMLSLKEMFDDTKIEYIHNNFYTILLYSMGTLYSINRKLKIKIYNNVIGYACKYDMLLILFNDNRVSCVCSTKMYKIDVDVNTNKNIKLEFDTNDIFNGIDHSLITKISINFSEISVVVSGRYIYWGRFSVNKFYDDVKTLTNIKNVFKCNDIYFCLLKDRRLLFKKNSSKYELEVCLDVVGYVFISSYLVCFHSDKSVTVIQYRLSKIMREIEKPINPKLYTFLTNGLNTIKNIKASMKCNVSAFSEDADTIEVEDPIETIESINFIMYLTKCNTIEILDIENMKLMSLSTIIDVDADIQQLNLFSYGLYSYI